MTTSAVLDRNVRSQRRGGSRHRGSALACALAVLAAAGCGGGSSGSGGVTITYDQAANFSSYRATPGDPPVSTPGAIFVMYRITKIRYAGSGASPFMFDKHKVLVGEEGRTRNEEPADDAKLLGDKLLTKVEVAPGKTVENAGCIIKLVDATDPSKLGETLLRASYEKGTAGVVSPRMERQASDNVTTLVTQATNVTLRGFC